MSSVSRTSGRKWKLTKEKFRKDIRKYFFTQRVVNVWNSLSGHAVEAGTLGVFKTRLDRVLDTTVPSTIIGTPGKDEWFAV